MGGRSLQRRRLRLLVAAALLGLFSVACWPVANAGWFPGDRADRSWIAHPHPSPVLGRFADIGDWLGHPAVAVLTVAALTWLVLDRRGWRFACLVPAAAAVPILTTSLKALLGPTSFERAHAGSAHGGSLPSGHTAYAVAVFGLMAWLIWTARGPRLLAAACGLVALAMGPARVVAGAHWPSDVVAGYAIGLGWLLAVVAFAPAPRTPWRRLAEP